RPPPDDLEVGRRGGRGGPSGAGGPRGSGPGGPPRVPPGPARVRPRRPARRHGRDQHWRGTARACTPGGLDGGRHRHRPRRGHRDRCGDRAPRVAPPLRRRPRHARRRVTVPPRGRPLLRLFGLGMALYFAAQGAGNVLWPVLANLAGLAIAGAGGWLALYSAGNLSYFFLVLSAALTAFGLISAAAVAAGAWFGPIKRPGLRDAAPLIRHST